MAYATDSDLTSRVAAASAVDVDARTLALADAKIMISDHELAFAAKSVRAHVMLAAHYLQLGGFIAGGEAGSVASLSMGSVSASFATAAAAMGDPLLATTPYGRQFLQISNAIVAFPGVA